MNSATDMSFHYRIVAMRSPLRLAALLICILSVSASCNRQSSEVVHTGEPLVFVEEGIQHEGAAIALGYRASPTAEDPSIEPITVINREGLSVTNAMVFCSLASPSGEVAGEEAATVYVPASEKTPAHYGRAKLSLPKGASPPKVRFRIILPGTDQEWTGGIEVKSK
jgi:hypothetical protein